MTPWEGASRCVAVVWSSHFKNNNQRVSNQLMYITDWLPTFYTAAGLDLNKLGNIDGIDMWKTLVNDTKSRRNEFIYNIHENHYVYAALRYFDWKYVYGTVSQGKSDQWYGESGRFETEITYSPKDVLWSKAGKAFTSFVTKQQINEKKNYENQGNMTNRAQKIIKFKSKLLGEKEILALRKEATIDCGERKESIKCNPLEEPCLFHLKKDPCETNNLAKKYPVILNIMETIVDRCSAKHDMCRATKGFNSTS
uniref:Uncharacterized protein n=1 Tax=Clastoptera arizonana TaxID=38151 RepID=A0A1B6DBF7_9HEMI